MNKFGGITLLICTLQNAVDELLDCRASDTLRDFNFRCVESIIIFAQWKQATEC